MRGVLEIILAKNNAGVLIGLKNFQPFFITLEKHSINMVNIEKVEVLFVSNRNPGYN